MVLIKPKAQEILLIEYAYKFKNLIVHYSLQFYIFLNISNTIEFYKKCKNYFFAKN